MNNKLLIHRGKQEGDIVRTHQDFIVLNELVLNFFKHNVSENKEFSWINEMVFEEDMVFFDKERIYLLNELKQVLLEFNDSNNEVLESIFNLVKFIEKALEDNEDIYVWDG